MYYEDGSDYEYLSKCPGVETGGVNIGWLDRHHPFPMAEPEPRFVEALCKCLASRVNQTRGWHICDLCDNAPKWEGVPVETPSGEVTLGDAEIAVTGEDGTIYRCPDLIFHYVTVHHYRPPQAFVDAVLRKR